MLLKRAKNIDQSDYDRAIDKGLGRAFDAAAKSEESIEAKDLKAVVISDLHRGTGDRADDFARSARAYCAALGWYLEMGYELWLLGDVEELWENGAKEVIEKYEAVLELEKRFVAPAGPGLRRFYGNHDLDWSNEKHARRHLGDIPVREAQRLRVRENGSELGLLFLVHGHQGAPGSDKFRWIARFAVRNVWRAIQRSQGWIATTPAQDVAIRGKHDLAMMAFARKRAREEKPGRRPVVIAGHTHHPVFPGDPPKPPTEEDVRKLREALEAERDPARRAATGAQLELFLAERRADPYVPPDFTPPCYFNTGCASFPDGDVTCLELSGEPLADTKLKDPEDGRGKIRLMRWLNNEGKPRPHELASQSLREILAEVNA